jgi:pimeloyl-ACP methyl ester carboxylesterase
MATYLVAHGAWSAGWAWKKMRPLLRARGHELFTPTYTGLGERAHLASPAIDLETHVADVLGVLQCEDLKNVILVAHSYGGMVATGVADRAHDRIASLVYVDAFAPRDGDSVFSLTPDRQAVMVEAAHKSGDGWKMPVNPMPPDTPEADQAWAMPRRMPQPLKTVEQKLRLQNGELTLPRHYIYCKRCSIDDRFRQFYDRARREGWGHDEIDASHNPHITTPEALAELLEEIAIK